MEKITLAQVKELLEKGCVVFPYPRKGQIRVNGFKLYEASAEACKMAKELNKAKLAK